jgi:hypothetical protein
MARDLVTWEKVKAVLNIIDEDREELVKFLISAASSLAEKIAGRPLAARFIDITIDSDGGGEFLLPGYPVNETLMITVNGSELNAGSYSIRKETGAVRIKGRVPEGWDVIGFKGNVGYDPVPEDLQQAVIEIISANLRRFSGNGGGVGVKSLAAGGAVTAQYELDIPASSRSVFTAYRGARV